MRHTFLVVTVKMVEICKFTEVITKLKPGFRFHVLEYPVHLKRFAALSCEVLTLKY